MDSLYMLQSIRIVMNGIITEERIMQELVLRVRLRFSIYECRPLRSM